MKAPTTVASGKPEGSENSRGDRGVGRHKTSVGCQRTGSWTKALEARPRKLELAGLPANEEAVGSKVKRARSGDKPCQLVVGETPCRVNLGHGIGMKQAQKVPRGVNRREREKRCGRNEGGVRGFRQIVDCWY